MDVNFSGHVTRVVKVEESTQVGQARREALALAAQCGFSELDAGRVALAATELATNVLKHGRGGLMHLSLVQGRRQLGVELCAIDRGPGFVLAQCLVDGFSTGGTQGLGLGAIQRQAAVLEAWSDDTGTIVVARIYPEHGKPDDDLPYGALRLPMRHEVACGDAWHLRCDGDRLAVTLIDGLGHGLAATEAAQSGVAAASEMPAGSAASDLITRMHSAMSGTRGGAAAVACIDLRAGTLEFAGIGNIAASLCDIASERGIPSHPGIVGVQFRKVQSFAFPTGVSLLVLHSDGLQARWNLKDYPGLWQRHPALIAAVLQRDFDRGRDDASIVVLRMGAFR